MATFHSLGTTPVSRDKLMTNDIGLVKTRAASLRNPEGKLPSHYAFFHLGFLSSLRISDSLAV